MKKVILFLIIIFSAGLPIGSYALEHRDRATCQKLIDNNIGYRYFETFPAELTQSIILQNADIRLDAQDISNLAQVNRYFYRIIEDLRRRGKLRYPTIHLAGSADQLATKIAAQTNTDTRRLVLECPENITLAPQLIAFKKLKQLYLKTPCLIEYNDNKSLRLHQLIRALPNLELLKFKDQTNKRDFIFKESHLATLPDKLALNSANIIATAILIWSTVNSNPQIFCECLTQK